MTSLPSVCTISPELSGQTASADEAWPQPPPSHEATAFLEADEFEPVWDECLGVLGDKPVALFGSYDWGTGEWMETWKENAETEGANVVDTVIANNEPDDEALEACKELGAKLA